MRLFRKSTHIWLRAESLADEARTPLVPADAELLVEEGVRVTVERSGQRIFADRDYERVGCELVPSGSWPWAPAEAVILGMKDLPAADSPLVHTHVFYGHAFRGQPHAAALLERFRRGGGRLLDFDALLSEAGRPLVGTGYWAGVVGAALALWAWARQRRGETRVLPALRPYPTAEILLTGVESELRLVGADPVVLVTGVTGRAATGAHETLRRLGIWSTSWGRKDTEAGGPFPEALAFDVVVHCAAVQTVSAPFLDEALLRWPERRISVVSDVTCDVGNPFNVLPIYERTGTFAAPVERRLEGERPLDVIAIDRLPALIPRECSDGFSSRLAPLLLDLTQERRAVWERAERRFRQSLAQESEAARDSVSVGAS